MSQPMHQMPPGSVPATMDELEDKGLVFGRFSDEDYDGIKEGNGKIPWWLVLIAAVTILEAFLWAMPWPGFGQRYDSVTTTFVSATEKQPFWDWGYYLIMLQIIVVMSGISGIVWIINWQKKKEGESKQAHGADT
jgi:hypothetical protein